MSDIFSAIGQHILSGKQNTATDKKPVDIAEIIEQVRALPTSGTREFAKTVNLQCVLNILEQYL